MAVRGVGEDFWGFATGLAAVFVAFAAVVAFTALAVDVAAGLAGDFDGEADRLGLDGMRAGIDNFRFCIDKR